MLKAVIKRILNKPSIIGVIASVNQGKSNLLYNIIEDIKDKAKVFTFGLKYEIEGVHEFNSIEELEELQDSVIVIDEFKTLFDIEDRKKKQQIEEILRFIYHNNNILILAGLPENYKKFLGAKLNTIIYKKCIFADFVNGSPSKKVIDNFKDTTHIKGTTQLNLKVNECLVFHEGKYSKHKISYLKEYDSKKNNKGIVKW